jgi:hypothetical protein
MAKPFNSKSSNVIRVPKPDRSSYNPDRPIAANTLLLHQIKHFHDVEMKRPPEQRTGIDFDSIKTEGEASEYIRRMTGILHPQVQKSGGR